MHSRRFTAVTYGYALLVSGVLAYFLFRIPIQLTDSLLNLIALEGPFLEVMREAAFEQGYLRPGLWAALKGVYDAAGGDYFAWYRGTHAVQVLLVVVLFVRLLDVRSAAAAAAAVLAIAVLIGTHTFAWTVREAFPINTFLTILVCCAVAANISITRYRWWNDVLAIVVFVAAALTLESGLLVLVIFVGGYLLGLPGISRRGVAALLVLLGAYLWVRFGLLSVGTPGLAAREGGFGFSRYSGPELTEIFGGNPLGFYVYNVLSSIFTVLFAEPRDGAWLLTRSVLVDGRPDPVLLFASISTALSTALIVAYGWRRRAAWSARAFTHGDRLVLLFAAVLGANAAISYGYTKDVIMSPAGFFFAGAVFVAIRDLIERTSSASRLAIAGAAVILLAVSVTWGVRAAGLHAALIQTSAQVREEWTDIDDYLAQVGYDPPPPHVKALARKLQHDAVVSQPARPTLRDEWARFFEVD